MRTLNEVALSAVTGNSTSSPIPTNSILSCSLQVISTGAIAGTVKLQFSNDRISPVNWSDIPTATVTISTAGILAIPKLDVCYEWVMVVATGISGSGTLTANIKAYGI